MNTPKNVDHNEIKKFDDIAETWWDPEGQFKPLHQINPLRLNYILQRAGSVFGKKILDVGCGGGILTESLAQEGATVTGIDMGDNPLSVAKIHALESGLSVQYVQTTAEQHAESHQNEYDIVTCMEMLEHVPDPSSIIAACAKMVKPDGHVFFSTLNRNRKSWLLSIVGAEYLLKMLPVGTHEYDKFIRPSELLKMANAAQLSEKHITGLHFNPLLNNYSLSARNVDVNYLVHCQPNP